MEGATSRPPRPAAPAGDETNLWLALWRDTSVRTQAAEGCSPNVTTTDYSLGLVVRFLQRLCVEDVGSSEVSLQAFTSVLRRQFTQETLSPDHIDFLFRHLSAGKKTVALQTIRSLEETTLRQIFRRMRWFGTTEEVKPIEAASRSTSFGPGGYGELPIS